MLRIIYNSVTRVCFRSVSGQTLFNCTMHTRVGGFSSQVFVACLLLLAACGICRAEWLPSGAPEPAQPQPEDQSLKKLSLEQLGNIEVTSVSKEPETLWTTAAAVYVLTADEIRRSGVTSVVDALRLVPGVNLGRDDANSYSVGVRGFENIFSKGLLVLIDGRSVYTTLFAGVYWDITSIPLEEIDRVEVIRGPAARCGAPML